MFSAEGFLYYMYYVKKGIRQPSPNIIITAVLAQGCCMTQSNKVPIIPPIKINPSVLSQKIMVIDVTLC